ncbi:MAG: hypothetical protein K0B02_04605 [DPANN group archaeon]|nr:hypothetical protein [DPANN group archaeon]
MANLVSSVSIALQKDFNLDLILKYKPFFFFTGNLPEKVIKVGSNSIKIKFSQVDNDLILSYEKGVTSNVSDIISKRVSYCLGCGEDLSGFYVTCESDKILKKYMGAICGNRLLSAYTDFEALVSIICSQNVSFLQYKKMVLNLINVYGFGAFPEPKDILLKPEHLSECGVGYRSDYILNVAKFMLFNPKIDDISRLSRIKGLGPYSIDIFCLFQMRKFDFFYTDSLIRKIVRDDYKIDFDNDKNLRYFAKKSWGPYQGLCEVYLQKFLYDIK